MGAEDINPSFVSFIRRQWSIGSRRTHDRGSGKTDLYIWALLKVDSIDKADLALVECQDEGMSAYALAKKTNAAQQVPIGHTGTGENDFLAPGQIIRVVDPLG